MIYLFGFLFHFYVSHPYDAFGHVLHDGWQSMMKILWWMETIDDGDIYALLSQFEACACCPSAKMFCLLYYSRRRICFNEGSRVF